ncbi:MAG: thioredoxin [Anaeroplasmataceae bacterium]|nr:thioredoxin [Anaeroplasmataceae bacterium]MDE5868014.1 thioredoxin [Anaeroplasmataceae bacterium]
MSSVAITMDNFKEEVSKGTILLDFWASWCGPCRMLTPVLEELSEIHAIKIGKINVDEQEELAAQFNINSIPALFLIKDGKVVNQTVGYQDLQSLEEFIKNEL